MGTHHLPKTKIVSLRLILLFFMRRPCSTISSILNNVLLACYNYAILFVPGYIMSLFSVIGKAARRGAVSLGNMSSNIFKAFKQAITITVNFATSYTSQGFHDVAKYTIDDLPNQSEKNNNNWSEFVAKFILFPITYLLGAIAAATIAPVAFYTYKNFLPYAKFTNTKLNEYTNVEHNIEYTEFPAYCGGPLKFYGLFGAFLGLFIGTIFYTIPKIIFYKIPIETMISMYIWGKNGLKIAIADERQFHITIYNRRFLSKIFGYFPVGIPLAALAFILMAGGLTFIRFVTNTFISLYNNTVRGYNFAVFDIDTAKAKILQNRTLYRQLLGAVGFVVGIGTGLLVATLVTMFRVILESAYNFYKVFTIGFSLPLNDREELKIKPYKFRLNLNSFQSFVQSIKISYAENVLGGFGYLLAPVASFTGIIFASTIRIAFESFISGVDAAIVLIYHIALRGRKNNSGQLYEEHPLISRKDYNRVIGILGFPVGLVLSFLPAGIIGIVRFGATNIDSGRRVFNYLTASVLPGKEKFTIDQRPLWVKVFSVPGASIGLILGSAVRMAVESYFSMINVSKLWIKTSLTYTPQKIYDSKYLQIEKSNRTNYSRAWGVPGYVLGIIISSPIVLGIAFSRFILTNADSAKREFAHKTNPKLSEKAQIKLEEDKRNLLLKRAGYPGFMFGKIAGYLGLISIESAIYFEYIYKSSILTVLHEMESEAIQEIKLPSIKKRSAITGSPGIVLGVIAGSVSFIIIGSARIIFNTAQTIYHVTLDMVKFVRSEKEIPSLVEFAELARIKNLNNPLVSQESYNNSFLEDQKPKLRIDKRKNTPFYLGIVGLPIGGVVGLIAATSIGFFRIIKSTAIRAFNNGLFYSRFALPKDEKYNLNELQVEQTPVDKILGILGILFGIPLGIVGFLSLGAIRTIIDTIESIYVSIRTIANLPPVNYSLDFIDNRGLTDKILGIPGFIIGLPLGASIYFLRITVNIIYNTFGTAKRDIINLYLWAKGDNDNRYILGIDNFKKINIITLKSSRTSFEQHGFGFPGHIIGGAIGSAISSIIISARLVWHNLKSTALAFQETSNYVLKKKWSFADDYQYDNNINGVQIQNYKLIVSNNLKYLAALPGLILGGTLATIFVIAPHYAKEFIKNNYFSYKHLSKSLLNVGFEEFYFDDGFLADKRSLKQKIAGILGYLLAISTCGLVIVAHNLLKITTVIIGIIFSPPVFIYKLIYKKVFPRFDGKETDEKIQKIKNLYSSLENGEINTTINIKKDGNGGKGIIDFLRKSIIFNLNTSTEDILAAELEKAKNPTFDLEKEIREIKNKYHGPFFFTDAIRKRRNKEDDNTIDLLRKDIETYINDAPENSETFIYTPPKIKDRGYLNLFFHTRSNDENVNLNFEQNPTNGY